MIKINKKRLPAMAVFLILILAALGLRHLRLLKMEAVPTAEYPPWAVRSATVRIRDISSGFLALATVLTSAELTISGQVAGEILEMGPREGQSIKAGDLLARIDTREIDQQILAQEAKLSAAQSEAANEESELKRERDLLKVGGSSQSKVDSRQTAAPCR